MAFTGSVTALQSQRDPANTRIASLAVADSPWTGSWADANGVSQVSVAASSDYAVTATVEWSSDASTVDETATISVPASQEVRWSRVPARRYYRVKVANASGSTAALRVETRQHGAPFAAGLALPEPAPREHRLISVADVATEVAETGATSWVGSQAVASRATTSDPIGCYKRNSTGTAGVEVVAMWVDTDGIAVYSAVDVELRPVTRWVVGSHTRVAWAGASQVKPPGEVMPFTDTAPGPMWFKVIAATSPGGSTTHLQISVREVNS